MEKDNILDISWDTIIKIFIAIFIFYIIYLAREIALWFVFGLAISILLDPAVNFLRKLWIPKIIAVAIIYLSIFGILGLLIYLSAPVFIFEIKQFTQNLPDYFSQISPVLQSLGINAAQSFNDFTKYLLGGLDQSSKGVIDAIVAFFGGLSSAAFILSIAFFISLEEKGAERFLSFISPRKYQEDLVAFFQKAQRKVSGWFGARIVACLFVGVASFLIFYIFSIKYAFLLALFSGTLNFIPYIGPWITLLLLVVSILVSSNSLYTLLYVLIAVLIIQEVENKLLTPLLMKKIINLPPVLVLISLLVGTKIFGFVGAIFAVPTFGIIFEFVKEILEKRREESNIS